MIRRALPVLLLAVLIAPSIALNRASAPVRTFYSRHFRVTTDAPYRQAHEVSRHMDAVYDEFLRGLPSFIDDATGQSDLYLNKDRDGYIATLAGKEVNGRFTGGVFFARGDDIGLATWVGDRPRWQMISTLQHEAFHLFAHQRIGSIPPWVNEGLAEYFGNAVLVNRRLQTGRADPPRLARLKDSIENGTYFPIDTFIGMSLNDWNGFVFAGDKRSEIMYDQAWSYVHMLIQGNNGINAPLLEQYLARLSEGLAPRDAWIKSFGSNTAAFEQQWMDHVQDLEPDSLSTAIARLDFLASGLRLLHKREIEVKTIGDLQQHLVAGQFRMTRGSAHGPARVMAASDAENFQGPLLDGRSRRAQLTMQRSRNKGLPPTLRMTDLLHTPRTVEVVWSREDDGSLVYDFDFR